jgi:hydroxyacylglutathione hydrolase
MKVKRFINNIFNSNSYVLYQDVDNYIWVIDPGSSINELIEWIERKEKIIKGILLTHSHHDHINGLNDLMDKFSNVVMYASIFAKEGMMSSKINGSYYLETPFTIKHPEFNIVKENDTIQLWDEISLKVLETPGHDRDCISFLVENNLFTGDALIPGIKVHTKSKHGDKIIAKDSIKKIFELFQSDIMIWPGHSNNCLLTEVDKSFYID